MKKYILTLANVQALFALIQKKGITRLALTDGLIRSGVRSALATALQANSTLNYLNLSNNDLDDREKTEVYGDRLLCQSIAAHKGIRTLIFRNRDCSSRVLLQELKKNKRITYLDLSVDANHLVSSNTLLLEKEGEAFVEMVCECPLTHLFLAGRPMDITTAQAFGEAFKKNTTLTFIDLENSFIFSTAEVLGVFLTGLKGSSSVEHLKLSRLYGADADPFISKIVNFIQAGSSLRKLTLTQSECDLLTAQALYNAVLKDEKLILEFDFWPQQDLDDVDRQKMTSEFANEVQTLMAQLKSERDQWVAKILELMESRKSRSATSLPIKSRPDSTSSGAQRDDRDEKKLGEEQQLMSQKKQGDQHPESQLALIWGLSPSPPSISSISQAPASQRAHQIATPSSDYIAPEASRKKHKSRHKNIGVQ